MTFSPQRISSKSNRQRQREKLLSSAVQVKCKFCGNSFMALPEKAVCQKCGRPANRALELQWRVISLLVPFIGIGNALWIRSHSPVASNQGLAASMLGLCVDGAILYVARAAMFI